MALTAAHRDTPAPKQLVTFLSDGATGLADWTEVMARTAEYVLDWFHIVMRFTVLANTMKGLRPIPSSTTRTSTSTECSTRWRVT